MEMLKSSQQAMVPPFVISVLADPSGAFTTAAALVACVEKVRTDSEFAQKLVVNGELKFRQGFTRECIVEQYLKLFTELIS